MGARGGWALPAPVVAPVVELLLHTWDKSIMRKGWDCHGNKRNIHVSEIICDIFVIFRTCKPRHGDDRKTFEVMTEQYNH